MHISTSFKGPLPQPECTLLVCCRDERDMESYSPSNRDHHAPADHHPLHLALAWDQKGTTRMSGTTGLVHRHLVRNKRCSCLKPLHFGVIGYATLTEFLLVFLELKSYPWSRSKQSCQRRWELVVADRWEHVVPKS